MTAPSVQPLRRALLDRLLPPVCVGCGASTCGGTADLPAALCADCHDSLAVPMPVVCRRCGAPAGPHATENSRCPHCRGRAFRFQSVTCLGMYEGLLRELIVSGKWSLSAVKVRTVAGVLVAARRGRLMACGVDRILPIPQHWTRRLFRNFNAAQIVAREIGQVLGRPVDSGILRRARLTPPQKRQTLRERAALQKGSFDVAGTGCIQGKSLLLVDDILTTGATCDEAARVLLKQGARACHVAVLARVSAWAS